MESRSEQVVEAYKKRKLSISAFHRIQALIEEFEQQRKDDIRWAWIGVALIVAIVATALILFFGTEQVTLT